MSKKDTIELTAVNPGEGELMAMTTFDGQTRIAKIRNRTQDHEAVWKMTGPDPTKEKWPTYYDCLEDCIYSLLGVKQLMDTFKGHIEFLPSGERA